MADAFGRVRAKSPGNGGDRRGGGGDGSIRRLRCPPRFARSQSRAQFVCWSGRRLCLSSCSCRTRCFAAWGKRGGGDESFAHPGSVCQSHAVRNPSTFNLDPKIIMLDWVTGPGRAGHNVREPR